ncbi:MAG: hypothetical protein M3O80_09475 [Chloroflexota bacterium]|nr:hypothetical protein [Chloroflexota bacterium]
MPTSESLTMKRFVRSRRAVLVGEHAVDGAARGELHVLGVTLERALDGDVVG